MRRQPPVPIGAPPRLTPKTGRPSKALKGLAVHHCEYPGCGKTYTRKEHLLRHERTHRNELPYVCPDCGQGYARQDLLKRHSNLKHGHPLDPSLVELSAGALAELDGLDALITSQLPPPKPQHPPRNAYQNIQPQEKIINLSQQQPLPPLIHQQPLPQMQTPTRSLSITSHTLQGFQQLELSPAKVRIAPAPARSAPRPQPQPSPRTEPSQPRVLPVPWGARRFPPGPVQCNVDLLRAAAYGDLTEIRRLHLSGVDVLAIGNFDTGDPKSALYAAAEAIYTGFEDIQKCNGRDREKLCNAIASKAEVVKYLTFHGAQLKTLSPRLLEAVQKALLQGQFELGSSVEAQQQPSVGFRPIAAASSEVKLRPMSGYGAPAKEEKISLPTDTLQRIKTEAGERKGGKR